MAAPVINTIRIVYKDGRTYKLPGEPAELFIEAIDGDGTTVTVLVTVKDAAGHETTGTATVVQSDPLTYAAVAPGAAVTQDPTQPNHFYVV